MKLNEKETKEIQKALQKKIPAYVVKFAKDVPQQIYYHMSCHMGYCNRCEKSWSWKKAAKVKEADCPFCKKKAPVTSLRTKFSSFFERTISMYVYVRACADGVLLVCVDGYHIVEYKDACFETTNKLTPYAATYVSERGVCNIRWDGKPGTSWKETATALPRLGSCLCAYYGSNVYGRHYKYFNTEARKVIENHPSPFVHKMPKEVSIGNIFYYKKATEMLCRCGFRNLFNDYMHGYTPGTGINTQAKSREKIFRIPEYAIRYLRKNDGGLGMLKRLQEMKLPTHPIPDEDISFQLYLASNGYMFSFLKALPINLTLKEIRKALSMYGENHIAEWRDYLSAAIAIGYDMTRPANRIPKKLNEEHDQAIAKQKEIEYSGLNQKIADRKEQICYLGYAKNGYIIAIPEKADEIVREGRELSHCVSRYAEDHANGRTCILFVRKAEEPTKPFVTIEIDEKNKSIRQVRGFKNGQPPKEVQDFLDEWLLDIKQEQKKRRKKNKRIMVA